MLSKTVVLDYCTHVANELNVLKEEIVSKSSVPFLSASARELLVHSSSSRASENPFKNRPDSLTSNIVSEFSIIS